jgi:hypothetical protein
MNIRRMLALVLVFCFFSQAAVASHVVTDQEIRNQISNVAADRTAKICAIQKLLRHEAVQSQIRGLADLERIERTLPALDDETLDQLASESQRLSDELQAGEICGATLALIVLIAAVIVVAIVAYA